MLATKIVNNHVYQCYYDATERFSCENLKIIKWLLSSALFFIKMEQKLTVSDSVSAAGSFPISFRKRHAESIIMIE